MNNETVEQAAIKYAYEAQQHNNDEILRAFDAGSDWKAKRSYSQEEVIDIAKEILRRAADKRDICCDLEKINYSDLLTK